MSIDDFMIERENQEKKFNEKIIKSNKRLKELLKNPAVIDYLTEEKNLKNLEKKKKKNCESFELNYQTECDHPMFALIDSEDLDTNDIYCIVCGKKIDIEKEQKPYVMKELFEQKKLIAKYTSISERTNQPIFETITDSLKTIKQNIEILRNNYYKYFLSIKRRKETEALPSNLSEDDAFFEYFCLDGYDRLLKDKKKNQHIKRK